LENATRRKDAAQRAATEAKAQYIREAQVSQQETSVAQHEEQDLVNRTRHESAKAAAKEAAAAHALRGAQKEEAHAKEMEARAKAAQASALTDEEAATNSLHWTYIACLIMGLLLFVLLCRAVCKCYRRKAAPAPGLSHPLLKDKREELAGSRSIKLPTEYPPAQAVNQDEQEEQARRQNGFQGFFSWLIFGNTVHQDESYERTDSLAAPYMRTNTENKWAQHFEAMEKPDRSSDA